MILFNKKRGSGFSLLEMSISVIVISFSFVAVMAGVSLVKQAEIRSIISDISSMRAYVSSFKLTI